MRPQISVRAVARNISAAGAALALAAGTASLPAGPAAAAAGGRSRAAAPAAARHARRGELYYVSGAYIVARPVAGGAAHRVVKVGQAGAEAIARADGRLYWITLTGTRDAIRYVRLSAPARTHKLVSDIAFPAGLVAAGGWLYWAGTRAIGRVRPDGAHLSRRFIPLPEEAGGGVADGLATDGRHLFFSRCQDAAVGRVDTSGAHLRLRFIQLRGSGTCPQALAVGHTHLYWAQLPGYLGRATLSGRHASARWLRTGSSQGPFAVAADSVNIYWTWGGVAGSPIRIGRARVSKSGFDRRFLVGDGALLLTSAGAGR